VDLAEERRLVDYLVAGAERGLFHSAHDCSQGGLGVALAEIAMGGAYEETGFGLEIDLTAYGLRLTADELLFSESHGRAVITCAPERAAAVAALAQELGVAAQTIGTVGERGGALRVRLRDATVEHPVDRLRQVYFTALPRRMGD
jgi:phosphoribosylformylglycinamidine synthase